MKKTTLCLWFLLILSSTFGQQEKIDSLESVLKKTSNFYMQVNLLKTLEKITSNNDINKALEYNQKLISISKKNKNDSILAEAYVSKTILLIKKDKVLPPIKQTSDLVVELYKKQNKNNKIRDFYSKQAKTFYALGKKTEAIKIYEIIIAIDSLNKNEQKLLKTYLGVGVIHLSKNNINKAIKYFLHSLKLSEKYNNDVYKSHNLKKIADAYLIERSLDKAETYLNKAKISFEKLKDTVSLAGVYNSLAIVQEYRKNIDNSLEYSLISLKFYKKGKNINAILTLLKNVGLQYEKKGDLNKAYSYFKQAYSLAEKHNNKRFKSKVSLALARLHIKNNRFKAAKELLQYYDPKIKNNLFNKIDEYELISEAYAQKNKFKEGYTYLRKYIDLSFEKTKKIKDSKLSELETQYQTEKKEKENLQLREEKAQQELLLQKENQQKWILLVTLLAMILALGVFAFYYKRNKKQKELIERLQRELHHRIKNNLAVIDSLVEDIKQNMDKENVNQRLTDLQNRIISINEIHSQLYRNKDITNLSLQKYVQVLATNIANSFANPNIEVQQEIPINLQVETEKLFPVGLIINEFITNSYKYAFEPQQPGVIKISVKETAKEYKLHLADNGKGLPKNFNIAELTSFGMEVIQLLSKQLQGTFELNGTNGVQININFPKN